MVLLSVVAIGCSMIGAGVSSSLWQLILFRLITGLGVGALLASLATITAEYTPHKYRSLAVVVVTAGYPLGATLGGVLAVPLLSEYGWRSVFLAGGTTTLAMFLVVYVWVPESMYFLIHRRPQNALARLNAILARFGRAPATALPEEQKIEAGNKANVFSLLIPERRSKTIQLWSTFFFCFICLYFLMSWIPKLVVNAGLSETYGVYASAVFNGGAVLGIVVLGWLASRISLSRLIGLFLLLTGCCMLLFALSEGRLPLLPMLLVIGFFLQGGFCGLYAVAAKIYPTEVRSTGVGWAIGLGRFGAVVGPYAGGLLIAAGFSMEANFILYAVPTLLAGILAWRLFVD
jgi:MFS family permease